MIQGAVGSRRRNQLITVAGLLIGAWGLRFLLGGELLPGNDMTGHLQRTAYGIDELLLHGRLDGWYPASMLGYQLFLFYGPGLTVLIGLARLATLGLVSDAGALQLVLVVAYLAIPLATARLARAFGVRPTAAAGAGVLALAVGSTRGGGIDGAFATGLAAQHVAMPLVVLALALVVEHATQQPGGVRPSPLPLALTVAALALTHPLSLVMLAVFAPLCLGTVWFWTRDRFAHGWWRSIGAAGLWSLGLSAWWWLPAIVSADLHGPVTSFTLPGVWEHVELLVTGQRGWRAGSQVPVAAVGVTTALADGLLRRNQRMVGLAVLPLVAFYLLHALHGILGINHDLGRQLPNRGLVLVALLMTPAAATSADAMAQWIGSARRLPAARLVRETGAWFLLAAAAAWSVTNLEIGAIDRYRPVPELREAAVLLSRDVPDGGRIAWVDGSADDLGVPEPQRWLAWKADRDSLTPFGPEYAPGAGSVSVASIGPGRADVDGWIDRVRELGATHIATGNQVKAELLARSDRVIHLLDTTRLDVWRIEPRTGKPVGSIIPTPASTMVEVGRDRYVVDVVTPTAETEVLALGYSPGWGATIDGQPTEVRRSPSDRVELDIPAGAHRIVLSFDELPAGPIGRIISLLTLAIAGAVAARRQSRRSTRSEPVAATSEKSISTARR